MSPTLILGDGTERPMEPLVPFDLRLKHTLFIGPLEMARLPHDICLKRCITPVKAQIMVIGKQGIFLSRQLWVEVSLVEDGVLYTPVFNMGNERVRIGKGDSISQLMWLGSGKVPPPEPKHKIKHKGV